MTLAQLHDDLVATGCNKNDHVIILITECINCGINSRSAIVSELVALGFNPRHGHVILSKNQGSAIGGHPWQKSDDGTFMLHPQ